MKKIRFIAALVGCAATFASGAATRLAPITDGLVLRLDATDLSSLTRDGTTQKVSAWASTVGELVYASEDATYQPWYWADAFGGLGGVVFGLARPADLTTAPSTWTKTGNWLQGSAKVKNRTVFVVLDQYQYDGTGNFAIYGWSNQQFTMAGNVLITYGNVYKCSAYPAKEYTWWIDGENAVDYPKSCSTVGTVYPKAGVKEGGMLGLHSHAIVVHKPTTEGDTYVTCLGWCNHKNLASTPVELRGAIGEVLVYDRVLSETEIFRVQSYLDEKWNPSATVSFWKDNATGSWDDADNWDGPVPTGANAVAFVSSGAPTVSGSASCGRLFLDHATLTLAPGSSFTVGPVYSETGTAGLAMTDATLSLATSVGPYGGVSRTLFGGTAQATICGNSTLVVGERTRVELKNARISGSFAKRGLGSLVMGSNMLFATDASCRIAEGTFDLNGHDLEVAGMGGLGIVTNSGAAVTLTVNAATQPAEIGCGLRGAINLVRTGAADVSLAGSFSRTGTTELGGGRTVLSADDWAEAIPEGTPALHLDASHKEQMTFDADGRVLTWTSSTGASAPGMQSLSFRVTIGLADAPASWGLTIDPHPCYDATAFGGRGAVVFGRGPDGTAGNTYLAAPAVTIKPKAIFIVVHPEEKITAQAGLWGMFEESYAIFYNNLSSGYNTGGVLKSMDVRLNGRLCRSAGTGDVTFEKGTAHLLSACSATAYDKITGYAAAAQRSIGIGCSVPNSKRFFTGEVAEILVYECALSEASRKRIEASLMRKWGLAPDESFDGTAEDFLPSALSLAQGATLDLNGTTNSIGSLAYSTCTVSNGLLVTGALEAKAGADGALPTLSSDFNWNLSDIDLLVTGCAQKNLKGGRLLGTTATITGEFNSVDGADRSKIRYSAGSVRYANTGLMILLK